MVESEMQQDEWLTCNKTRVDSPAKKTHMSLTLGLLQLKATINMFGFSDLKM